MSNGSTCPIDRTQSAAPTPSPSEPRWDGNEQVLRLPQCSCITGASPSDCLLLGDGFYSSSRMLSVCSTASADLAITYVGGCPRSIMVNRDQQRFKDRKKFTQLYKYCEARTEQKLTVILFTRSLRSGRYDTRSIFKQSLTGLNSEFFFSETSCLTKAEEPTLPYYLPIAGGRIIGFIPFPRVLVLCEMQLAWSRI